MYLVLVLLRPLLEAIGGSAAYGLAQRLGTCVQPDGPLPGNRTVWIHASSVGEVQAAIVLVSELSGTERNLRLVLTSTTEQGHRLALSRMPGNVSCLMAPLDLLPAVRRVISILKPDIYICLETELWPVMLRELSKAGVGMLLLNGRLSQRSFARYTAIGGFMASLLSGFHRVAVITEADGRRYAALGVPQSRIQVCGNIKYDIQADEPDAVRQHSRQRLDAGSELVFICGSTHDDEEALLLRTFQQLAQRKPCVWVIAPRHLERLHAVQTLLAGSGTPFDLFSQVAVNGRKTQVVLVDSMGDLADLYAAGDFIFCGGSLVDRGGHNIMEAARWGRPVCFGPHMKDFQDAADMLLEAGGGFQVADAAALTDRIVAFLDNPEQYGQACARAGEAAASQRGAARMQADIVRQMLAAC